MLRFSRSNSQADDAPAASDAASDVSAEIPRNANKRSGGPWPIHPILFALFPILSLFVHNMGQVPFIQLQKPLGLSLLGTAVVWTLLLLLTRNMRKAAVATAVGVIAFFSYRHVLDVLPSSLQILVTPGYVIVLTALLALILRSRGSLREVTTILNFMGVVLIAPSLWTIGISFWRSPGEAKPITKQSADIVSSNADRPPTGVEPPRHLVSTNPDLPDVYYVILDAYGRADRLKEFYGYDNTPFINALQQRGFYIPAESRSNYDQTPLCLASALSMNYLDNLQQQLSPEVLRQAVDDNAVSEALRKFGYHYVSIWSGLEVSRVTTADVVLNNQPELTGFEGQAVELTPMGATSAYQRARYDKHRERMAGVFDNLEKVVSLPYQKFVFAHVLAPHPPFVFDAQGSPVTPRRIFDLADASQLVGRISREEYERGYIGQLQYVNRRVLQAVDAILKQSRRPPIIILQGDHGSRMTLDWDSLEKTDLREPFSIFNAYYVPEKTRHALYDTITPVNSFRIVLNTVFGGKYARLRDRSYYSTADQPFNFTEVTQKIPK